MEGIVSNAPLDDMMDLDTEMDHQFVRVAAKQTIPSKSSNVSKASNGLFMTGKGEKSSSMSTNQTQAAQHPLCSTSQVSRPGQAEKTQSLRLPLRPRNNPRSPPTSKSSNRKQANGDGMELDIERPRMPVQMLKLNLDFDTASTTSLYLDQSGNKQENIDDSFLKVVQQETVLRKEILITVCYQCPTKETSRQGYGPQLFNVVPFYELDYKFWTFRYFREGWRKSEVLMDGSALKSRILTAARDWNKSKKGKQA
ncbi:hypothetical protein HYALB_00011957 [Hymenoscyphus albidus]|uniref:Uncharacterized protein n=1 Tax=Hymenoscyphus albidus TaxID=595503 RepID=A0A9N9LQH3_9HELO|nr:hypothetical protein HYALB_00011957 [Hymenoscyphus albidus]